MTNGKFPQSLELGKMLQEHTQPHLLRGEIEATMRTRFQISEDISPITNDAVHYRVTFTVEAVLNEETSNG